MEFIRDYVKSKIQSEGWITNNETLNKLVDDMITPQLSNIKDFGDSLSQLLLAEQIINSFHDESIKEFEPVGINAALTLGESISQDMLQSHHKAGLQLGTEGFPRIEQIFKLDKSTIVKIIASPTNIIYPDGSKIQVPKSKREVYDLAYSLKSISVNDLLHHYDVQRGEYPTWYNTFCDIFSRSLPQKDIWLRIYLDPEKLYRYKVTPYEIFEKLSSTVEMFIPPSSVGFFIDIFPDTDKGVFDILPNIMSLYVGTSDISNIKEVSVLPEDLLQSAKVTLCNGVYEFSSDGGSYVPDVSWRYLIEALIPDAIFNPSNPRQFKSSYTEEEISNMIKPPRYYGDLSYNLETIGDQTTITFDTSITNSFPFLLHGDLNPITLNTKDVSLFLRKNIVERRFFWYIEANLIKPSSSTDEVSMDTIYMHSGIDTSKTYPTSPILMRDNQGLLAARKLIYEELKANININPIHASLITNLMTAYKNIMSINDKGMAQSDSEWLTFATFEGIKDTLTCAAFCGSEDRLKSIASKTVIGKPISIGRGGKNLTPKTVENPMGNKFKALLIKTSI